MSTIHVLTLTWNGLSKLAKCANGVIEFTHKLPKGTGMVWHIRDNGSTDGTMAEIEQWGDAGAYVTAYAINHNRDSFAKGVNFLFEQAKPADDDFILLLNNDVEIADPLSINMMLDLMKPGVGVVGAKLVYPIKEDHENYKAYLQHAGVIFGPRYGNMPYHYRHNEIADSAADKNRYFQAVTAACCLVRASSFKRIGGMDEGFRWAFDDVDMCLQIGQKEKIAYCGTTGIIHEESASLKKNPVHKMFMQQNVKRFKDKWTGKYKLDHELYLKDPLYNEIKK